MKSADVPFLVWDHVAASDIRKHSHYLVARGLQLQLVAVEGVVPLVHLFYLLAQVEKFYYEWRNSLDEGVAYLDSGCWDQ